MVVTLCTSAVITSIKYACSRYSSNCGQCITLDKQALAAHSTSTTSNLSLYV